MRGPRVPGFLLRDRITIEPYLGAGAYGDQWGPPVTVKAHVEPASRLVIDRDGQTARAEAVVIVRPEVGHVEVESKVTANGRTYRVLQSGGLPDEVRPTHRELAVG